MAKRSTTRRCSSCEREIRGWLRVMMTERSVALDGSDRWIDRQFLALFFCSRPCIVRWFETNMDEHPYGVLAGS